ncbi:THA2 aldolase, partial [Peucedramus taeniatus]|nr:THA2 aldolase [Peucedramus taeniatus]
LMNAAVAQGVEPAQIAQHCDSVSLCFSKGLGAPAGAVLAGSRRTRRPRCAGTTTTPGALRKVPPGPGCAGMYRHARRCPAVLGAWHHPWMATLGLQAGIPALDSPLCSISPAAVETNIVMVNVQGAWPSPAELCARLRAVSEEEEAETGQAVSVLLLPWSARTLRAVWHRDISARDTELARRKLEFVARKCQE